jgi:predicted permease
MAWLKRLRTTLLASRPNETFEEEARFHFDQRIEEYMRAGMTRERATRAAQHRFGSVAAAAADTRDRDTLPWVRDLSIDVRYGARLLRKSPAFTIVATLAVGIGLVTAFFAIVNAVVLTPIASHADTVVRIWKHDREQTSIARFPISYAELSLWREKSQTFSALAAISHADVSEQAIMVADETWSVGMSPVSAEFFSVMQDGPPLMGRWFTAAEEEDATELATVISQPLWQRLGGDPAIVGRRLLLPGGKRAVVIVGVAPASLAYPSRADMWVPLVGFFKAGGGLVTADVHSRRFTNFHFLGRLAPGVSREQAHAELEVLNRGVAAQFPEDIRVLPVVAEPLLHATLRTWRPLTLFLFAGAAVVFLAAAANVAALLLMRASLQARDVALRLALGAGRFRIARQTFVEAAALGLAGAVGGLLIAQGCVVLAKAVAVTQLPRIETAAIEARVLGFCVLITFLWVVTCGSAPLWRRRKLEAGHLVQQLSTRTTRSATMLRAMVVGQVTAAVVVAAAAGLLVRSLVHLSSIERGFNTDNLAVARLLLPESLYPTAAAREQFISQLLPLLRSLPGIADATTTHLGPGTGQTGLSARMLFEGQDPEQGRSNPYGTWEPTTPSYFNTMGVRLLSGRVFTDADDAAAPPVAVVSQAVATRYWPGQDAVGKRLQFTSQFPWVTVIGVVADTRYRELTQEWLTVYFPAKQFFFYSPGAVVVRTNGNPTPLFADIRRTIKRAEPAAAVHSADTMEQLLARESAGPRAAVAVAVLFAFIAVFVTAIGVYAVFSYDLSQRARELAVHSAIGASPGRIIGMTLSQSLGVGVVGALTGLGLAAFLTRYLAAVLFEIQPLDALTFGFAGVAVLGVVLLASVVPARRAACVDPVALLRAE